MTEDFLDRYAEAFRAAAARRASPWVRTRRAALPIVLAAAVIAAVIGAILSVDRTPPRETPAVPPEPGLLSVRVPDPDGGLPWGVRRVPGPRGTVCLQAGRVSGGKLGYLAEDGHFRALGERQNNPEACAPPDSNGHFFASVLIYGTGPSGRLTGGCSPEKTPTPAADTCPAGGARWIAYGFLGPVARSVTYRDSDGRSVTQPVTGPDGAYLMVRRPLPGDQIQAGTFTPSTTPATGSVDRIDYRSGPPCLLTGPAGVSSACPARGFAHSSAPPPTEAALRTTATATLRPDAIQGHGIYRLNVTFTARAAARNGAHYIVTQGGRLQPKGGYCSANGVDTVPGDVKAGQRVVVRFLPNRVCHGVFLGRVGYVPAPGTPGADPYTASPDDAITAARWRVRTP